MLDDVDPAIFYVSTDGNDSWSGAYPIAVDELDDGPFATIERARDAIRELKTGGGLPGPMTVMIRGGIYELGQTLRFAAEDSGTEAAPITYRSFPGEQATLSGGRTITGWEDVGDGLYEADLSDQNLSGAFFHQLFYGDQRQILARHPNVDPAHPRTGGFAYIWEVSTPRDQAFYYEEGALPFENWGILSQAQVVTTYGRGWNFAITPILNVDVDRRLITVEEVRREFIADNRFIVQNIREALDTPGEWFFNRETSLLSFASPSGTIEESDTIVVPVLDHVIEVEGSVPYPHGYLTISYKGTREDYPVDPNPPPLEPVEYLRFEGLRLVHAKHDGIRLVGARDCEVVGNQVTNVGNVGINLGGVANAHFEVGNPRENEPTGFSGGVGGAGQDLLFNAPCLSCTITGNDVWSVGSDGIFLYGTANIAENNHVYDIGLFDKDCAGINAWGEENVVRRNTIHDVPRNAIFTKGIENLIELNALFHTMLETCDGGAIRMCQRNDNLVGTIIRDNEILDTHGYGYPIGMDYVSPYFSWGIYLDDITSGTTIQGNVIARIGRGGVMIHGGGDTLVENNIVVEPTQFALENLPIGEPLFGNRFLRNVLMFQGETAAPYRSGQWIEGLIEIGSNLVWPLGDEVWVDLGAGGGRYDSWSEWQAAGIDIGSMLADPLFTASEDDDYRLQPDSPAYELGFEDTATVDQIGCYEREDRAIWPLHDCRGLPRETPVLREAPQRPFNVDFEDDILGIAPTLGQVNAPSPSSIRVTDETASGGFQSLKIIDATGLPNTWNPNIYYPTTYDDGGVDCSFSIRLDSVQPPTLYADFRDYQTSDISSYLSGPFLQIGDNGELSVGGSVITTLPFDQWVTIELGLELGNIDHDTWNLTVSVGDASESFGPFDNRSVDFLRLDRVVFASLADTTTIFFLDDIYCEPL